METPISYMQEEGKKFTLARNGLWEAGNCRSKTQGVRGNFILGRVAPHVNGMAFGARKGGASKRTLPEMRTSWRPPSPLTAPHATINERLPSPPGTGTDLHTGNAPRDERDEARQPTPAARYRAWAGREVSASIPAAHREPLSFTEITPLCDPCRARL